MDYQAERQRIETVRNEETARRQKLADGLRRQADESRDYANLLLTRGPDSPAAQSAAQTCYQRARELDLRALKLLLSPQW